MDDVRRLALEAAGIGVWDVDAETGERRWSPEMRAILGVDEGVPADPALFTRLIHPDDRAAVVARYDRLYRDDSEDDYEIECRIHRGDTGELRWIALRGRVVRDAAGVIVRGIGAVFDITDRKGAERTLGFQSLLLDAMTEGVSLSDEDGIIVYTNRAEDGLFGYAPGELLGRHVSVQNAYEPDENAEIVAGVIADLKARGVWEGEWRNRRKDGTEFYTAARITTVQVDGRMHFLCVQRDVTLEREARERELLLAAEVDHRARNALAVVQSLVRLTPFDSRVVFVETLTGRINAMARVHTLLSRNAWKGATVREVVSGELAPFDTGGKITIAGPDFGLRLEAAQSLGLLVHELTTNAGKYGALSAEAGRLSVRWAEARDGAVELEWKETGVSVSAPARTGFGTKLIKGAAGQLAGELIQQWEPDGLRCRLLIGEGRLQAAEARPPVGGNVRALSEPGLNGARVLVVEDEALLAMELADQLSRAGAVVVGPANTVEDGLVLAREGRFDAAVLDVNLGGRTAAPLAALLSERAVPFVLVTGYDAPDIPAPAVMQKPVDHASLLARLGELLGKAAPALA